MMDTGTFIPGGYPLIVIILMCLVEMFTSTTEVIAKDKESMKALFKRDKRKESAKDEITDEEMANAFIMPEWFKEDVTNNPSYHNSNLSKKTF